MKMSLGKSIYIGKNLEHVENKCFFEEEYLHREKVVFN